LGRRNGGWFLLVEGIAHHAHRAGGHGLLAGAAQGEDEDHCRQAGPNQPEQQHLALVGHPLALPLLALEQGTPQVLVALSNLAQPYLILECGGDVGRGQSSGLEALPQLFGQLGMPGRQFLEKWNELRSRGFRDGFAEDSFDFFADFGANAEFVHTIIVLYHCKSH